MSAVDVNPPKKVAKTDAGIREKFEAMFSSGGNSGAKDGKGGRAHPNFMKLAFAKTGKAYNLGMQQYSKLAPNQRSGALIAAVVLLFWPLLGLAMMAPWVLLAVIVVHSVFYGFPDFVQDLEEAILMETRISEKNAKHVKDVSKNLQTNWVNVAVYGKKFAAIGREYAKVAVDYVYKLGAQAKDVAAEKGQAKPAAGPAKKPVEEKKSQ